MSYASRGSHARCCTSSSAWRRHRSSIWSAVRSITRRHGLDLYRTRRFGPRTPAGSEESSPAEAPPAATAEATAPRIGVSRPTTHRLAAAEIRRAWHSWCRDAMHAEQPRLLRHADRHGLVLGVVLQPFFAQLAAHARHLEAAERSGGVEHVVAVDPHGAGPQLIGQRVALPTSRVQTAAARP